MAPVVRAISPHADDHGLWGYLADVAGDGVEPVDVQDVAAWLTSCSLNPGGGAGYPFPFAAIAAIAASAIARSDTVPVGMTP